MKTLFNGVRNLFVRHNYNELNTKIKIPVNQEGHTFDLMQLVDGVNLDGVSLDEKASPHDAAILELAKKTLHLNCQNFLKIVYKLYTSLNKENKASFSCLISTLLSQQDFEKLIIDHEEGIIALYLSKYYKKLSYSVKEDVKNIVISHTKDIRASYYQQRDIELRVIRQITSAASIGMTYRKPPCFIPVVEEIEKRLPKSIVQELSNSHRATLNKNSFQRAETYKQTHALRR